jgi:sodium-dependent dicarboxylate transporter 2/3/5
LLESCSVSLASEEPVPLIVSRVGAATAVLLFVLVWFWPAMPGLEPQGQRLAAVAALMAICWMTQALPMEVTSLLPLALFPLCGIQSAKAVASNYFSDSSFLYLGGFVIALGIEKWRLHRRMALSIVAALGVGTRRIVLGFMLATFVVSMWISNTASTLLMLPIGLALLDSLAEYLDPAAEKDAAFAHLNMATTLGIGYAATIGGMASLVGTPTNLVYVDVLRKLYPRGPGVSAGQWMTVWLPFALCFLLVAWAVLTWGSRRPQWARPLERGLFRGQLGELGRMQAGERWMAGLFALTVCAWLFRTDFVFGETVLLPGWRRWAEHWLAGLGIPATQWNDYINDSTVAMAIAVLLFLIPVRRQGDGSWEKLMDWRTAMRLPWGVLLLFGGGFALADACKTTGLAEWCGLRLAGAVQGQPVWLTLLAVCLLVTFLSELTSNVATANALLPMIAGTAVALGYDPRLLMAPAAIAASCGFMLPVSTPPHAIVFGSGRIRLSQMTRCGLGLNFAGALLIVAATYLLLTPQLGIRLGEVPDWAR